MARGSRNSRKDKFLNTRSLCGFETSNIGKKCSFNFSFFSPSCGGQELVIWANENGSASLQSLFDKLAQFTNEPLSYWENQRAGAGGLKVLAYYSEYPQRCQFQRPPSVPHDARWGRFRLGNKVRLAGFSVPSTLHNQQDKDGNLLDKNIFYVVYLDKDHEFYPVEAE
ncbi:hypothetical protein [Photobacterium damselae]|uniref:hypothetical protein n=1 Tax=Photobacterium damselae TaxID=38293 RepID=UPI002543C475|nr:hypothetical protein [Photobacterium damselae]WIH19044.1 hypothetical protein KQY33_12330 [Photobacterium damselae]